VLRRQQILNGSLLGLQIEFSPVEVWAEYDRLKPERVKKFITQRLIGEAHVHEILGLQPGLSALGHLS